MGIYKKYKDKNGNPTGPWFIQYPHERDAKTGKVKYKIQKASWKKKTAQEILRKKQDEFFEKDQLGIKIDPEMTFSQLMDWGLRQEVMKSKKSACEDENRVKHLKAGFGDIKAMQVTPLMADNFMVRMKSVISERTARPFSGTTINKMISLARRIYYLGMDAGKVNSNPFARRMTFKEEPKGKYIPSDEFRKIHENLLDYVKPIAIAAYFTGMRRAEIINLEWDNVNIFGGYLDLNSEDTKTEEPRRIYFNSIKELKNVFVEAERKRTPDKKLVFTQKDGKDISPQYMSRLFKKACINAKVGPYRFHDLRHTFNTNMSKAGVDKAVTMKLTGHKTLEMFLRYRHLDSEEAEQAMQKLDGFLEKKSK